MIQRVLEPHLRGLAQRHPVLIVTGPRQSGKTTLCRAVFSDRPYASLEAPDVREFATVDPRGFLGQFRDGAVLDEIQRAPELLSYIQGIVDDRRRKRPGEFVLTGSQHFGLHQAISQSLAGRAAISVLLPLGIDELRRFPSHPQDLLSTLWMGGYPAIHDRELPPAEWLSSYVATYVERDVRQLLNVGDLVAFQTFLRLCAGRSAQLVNLSALAADCGMSHNTARAWLSVLETSFLVTRLPPFHANMRKRLVKTPKLHVGDSGLLCYLLGIRTPMELVQHPLRGAVFETWVVNEILRARAHRGVAGGIAFYRDRSGLEVDTIVEVGQALIVVETKSGATLAKDCFANLDRFAELLARTKSPPRVRPTVVYGGDVTQRRTDRVALSFSDIATVAWSG